MPATVLIAEDDPVIGRLLAAELRGHGLDPVLTATGDEAIWAMEWVTPDALVLDLAAARTDGYRVLRHVQDRGYRFPVLVLSERGDREAERTCRSLGASDVILRGKTDAGGVGETLRRCLVYLSVARTPPAQEV